jgi:trimethylamine corrinoid protein
MSDQTFIAMRQSVMDGAVEIATALAVQAINAGIEPLDAINNGYVAGIQAVGELFGKGKIFLPDMMASAQAMREAMAVLEPELKKVGGERPSAGTIVLGTTRGDIHEIGKCLVGVLLSAHGFRVHDLGVNVAAEKFAAQAGELGADIVGVSALLTTTMQNQRGVIAALEKEGLRAKTRVMVGGAPVTLRWAEEIGADGYAKDAMNAVALARDLMQRNSQTSAERP